MPGDRTEQATASRREKARKDGDILHSRDLTSAVATIAAVLCLRLVSPTILKNFHSVFEGALELDRPELWEPPVLQSTLTTIRNLAIAMMVPIGTMMATMAGAAVAAGIMQTGGLAIQSNAVAPKAGRLNPARNIKNLFSLRSASRFGKSLIPAAILTIIAIHRIGGQFTYPAHSLVRVQELASDVCRLLATASWLMLAWALVDYLFEWRSRESRLMMSREEIKQEFKEAEGNPHTRGRIRSIQRQLRRRKVKEDVAKAAVVLTNPTHYAVALGFDFATMDAPKVLAKGRNLLAEEIKAEARWCGVPIIENPPLARSIYRTVEVGSSIPVELYAAVAAILAYLYRQRVEDEARNRRMRKTVSPAVGSEGRTANSLGVADASRRSRANDAPGAQRGEGFR
jgi:flagellar biosynthetic protein FlhB